MFQENDYIVVLEFKEIQTNCAKVDYVFKQRLDSNVIMPCVDLKGSFDNSNGTLLFNKSSSLIDWRYATPSEIALYELNGKPCSIIENIKPIVENFDYLIEIFTKLNIK